MSPREEPIDAWFVAFKPSKSGMWFHRPLKKGFQHCFAWAWDEHARCWLLLDPGFDRVYLRAFSDAGIEALMAALLDGGARILHARRERRNIPRPRLMLTCVSAIAALLGLPDLCAFTPYRLYRILLARGAVEIGGETSHGIRRGRR